MTLIKYFFVNVKSTKFGITNELNFDCKKCKYYLNTYCDIISVCVFGRFSVLGIPV